MPVIKLTLINADDGKILGQSGMPASNLPETFEKETTLHIADCDWEVVQAEPVTAREFISSGELKLTIKKVISVSPQELRFSLPTIAGKLPALSENYSHEGIIADMHEDNWRQCEFLPASVMGGIHEEMRKVVEIWDKHSSQENGYTSFENCHVRTIGDTDLNIDINELKALMNVSGSGPVKIGGNWVENGFMLEDGSVNAAYYGIMKDGAVSSLCIDSVNDGNLLQIKTICGKFSLVAVDWCRCRIIEA